MFISLEKIFVGQRPRGIQGDLQRQRQHIPSTTSDNKDSYAAKVLSKPHSSSAGRDASNIAPQISDVDPTPTSSSKAPPRYKVNERVIVFDKNDIALHGSVKWTGKKSRLGSEGIIYVGIEMVCTCTCIP